MRDQCRRTWSACGCVCTRLVATSPEPYVNCPRTSEKFLRGEGEKRAISCVEILFQESTLEVPGSRLGLRSFLPQPEREKETSIVPSLETSRLHFRVALPFNSSHCSFPMLFPPRFFISLLFRSSINIITQQAYPHSQRHHSPASLGFPSSFHHQECSKSLLRFIATHLALTLLSSLSFRGPLHGGRSTPQAFTKDKPSQSSIHSSIK